MKKKRSEMELLPLYQQVLDRKAKGENVKDVCPELGITSGQFYAWRKRTQEGGSATTSYKKYQSMSIPIVDRKANGDEFYIGGDPAKVLEFCRALGRLNG